MRTTGGWFVVGLSVAAPIAGIVSSPPPMSPVAATARAVAGVGSVQSADCTASTELRVDHVPIAVRDLAAAGELFRSLGFTLKPGRRHDNGIANLHAKFVDGTELELISASESVDALTREYVAFLRDGDGPAYLALYGGALDAVASRLRPLAPELRRAPGMLAFPSGHRWGRYFFGQLNRSPTDRPEHFAHPNGAHALAAVWLADDALSGLLTAFGAGPCDAVELLPHVPGRLVPLAAGSAVVLLPDEARLRPARPIVGVTVRVDDVEIAAELLASAGIAHTRRAAGAARSLLIEPTVAPGLWIELRGGAAGKP